MIQILERGREGRWEKEREAVEKIRMFPGTLLLAISYLISIKFS
ncbi:hypothetical protein [Clostridium acidisoli]|nr:hypothetical protein [Clostridium acidisoli]